MKLKLLGAFLVFLCALPFIAYFYAPVAAKDYVRDHYPGVYLGEVEVSWGLATFHDVVVQREGTKASLKTVLVEWSLDGVKGIELIGGIVQLDKKVAKDEASKSAKEYPLTGRELSVILESNDGVATLERTSFDSERVCFETGLVVFTIAPAPFEVTNGCFTRLLTEVTAKSLRTRLTMPVDLPAFSEIPQDVVISDMRFDFATKVVTFQSAEALPLLRVNGESKVSSTGLDVQGLMVNHPWISPTPVSFKRVQVDKAAEGGFKLTLNGASILVDLEHYHLQGKHTCDAWIEAMPTPLPAALEQARGHFSGELSWEVKKDPKPELKVHEACKFECSAEPIASLIAALRKRGPAISYMAYDKDNELFERKLGPATNDWVPISRIPESVTKAFITLEDPGFRRHNGIITQALENSFKDNLKLGKFFRGGSTISMQLAKNLFLKRHKTLGRKAAEALLTFALESCLSKDEILALYLNAVEFGPDLYGIGPAARHYFGKTADRLDRVEAFFLAALLPHPRKAVPPGKGGLERARRLMLKLAQQGTLSEEDLEDLATVPEEVSSAGWEAY